MKESPQTGYEHLSDTAALLIDQVCEKFEHALRDGKNPAIEEHLSSLPDTLRSVLLRELILVEVPHRQKAGQTPQWQEYRARFPGLEEEWLTQVIPAAGPAQAPRSGVAFPPAYEMVSEVGRGGMGVVFKARDVRLGRFVAVKMLPPELARDPQFVKRFGQEARAAGALNHPSVCTVHAFEEFQGQLFLVMEWIDGKTVRALLKATPGLQTVVGWLAQAAQALQAAHALGIVHRDIKPENMMVRSDGLVKVLDFGLARLPNQSLSWTGTTPGLVMGTARYMSPEQGRGEKVSSPTDVFALGVVLYECTTGEHPFPAGTLGGMLKAIENRIPPAPSSHNPEVPESLDRLILQMLVKDPQQRPMASQVAIELKDQATTISSRSTVRTLKATDVPPPAKSTDRDAGAATQNVETPSRKRWSVVAAVALAALALVGGLIWLLRGNPEKSDPIKEPGPVAIKPVRSDAEAREQLDAVIAKMKWANSGYDGERQYRIGNGAVVELTLKVDHLVDVSPLAELADLKALILEMSNTETRFSRLADIYALRKLQLTKLTLQNTRVQSIAICEDMPIEELDLTASAVQSLDAVKGKKIRRLYIQGTDIQDLTPIRAMPLEEANLGMSSLKDLSVLENSDLTYLSVHGAERLTDLQPLARMKRLARLSLNSTPVTDLKPLRGLPLAHLDLGQCSSLGDLEPLTGMTTLTFLDVRSCPIRDFTPLLKTGLVDLNMDKANIPGHTKVLRAISTLRTINGQTAATMLP